MAEKLLTIGEVADLTRTPIETLRWWRQRGTGPTSFRIGRRIVFREADVVEWIAEQARAQGAA